MKRISILVAAGAAAAGVFFAISPFAGAQPAREASTTVRVTATEYKFKLSRRSAPHGLVVFKLVNKGVLKHDFKIVGKKTRIIRHGKSAILRVRLKKGKHTYVCTVDSHAKFGMKGVFRST
jgi:plastocyanin